MATREGRLAEFNQGTPDADQPVQVLCEDHNGTYLLPYDCACQDGDWRNAKTGEPITSKVVGWRRLNRR
jgi:hypothetical protein